MINKHLRITENEPSYWGFLGRFAVTHAVSWKGVWAAATTGLGDCVCGNAYQNYNKILIIHLICFKVKTPGRFRFLL